MRDMELEEQNDRLKEIKNYLLKSYNKNELEGEIDSKKDKVKYVTLIYFFSSPNKKGIRMVDCSPKGSLVRFTKTTGMEETTLSKKQGTFITRQTSPTYIDWDEELNEVNKVTYVERPVGNDDSIYIIYTFIVSDAELENINRQINEKKADDNGLIKISVEDLYSFDEEYRFYKELAKNKKIDSIEFSENDNMIIPKENIKEEKNSTIGFIEKEENKLDDSLDSVKESKKSLIGLKKFLEKTFSKNKINNDMNINNKKNSTGGFGI